jgi:hypothetical protein
MDDGGTVTPVAIPWRAKLPAPRPSCAVLLSLVSAFGASACYGFASILQAIAVGRPAATEGGGAAALARLIGQWRYLAGLGLDGLGFLATVVALRTLPLFVVEAAVASSVGVTAIAATKLLHAQLSRRERQTLVALLIGLLLLAVAGKPEHAVGIGEPGAMLLLVSAAGMAVLLWALGRPSRFDTAGALALGAGAGFGAVGVAARAFTVPSPWTGALHDPLLYAIAAHGVVATLMYASALQRGAVTTVAAVTFGVETVVPAAIGILWLGDHARAGLFPVAAVGFVVTVAASIGLARFSEPADAAGFVGGPGT